MKKITAFLLILALAALTACGGEEPSSADETLSSPSSTDESIFDSESVPDESTSDESASDESSESSEEIDENINTFKNPTFSEPAADPFVTYHDGYYYGLKTNALQINLFRSRSIDSLFTEETKTIHTSAFMYWKPEYQGMEIPPEVADQEIQSNIWAPELHYSPITDRWYIYASGGDGSWDFNSIRMFCYESASNDPWSDYTYKGRTDPDVLAIDQTVFYDEKTGNLYTAFSEFTSDKGQVITVALMENPWTVSDKRIQVSYPLYSWETMGKRADKDSRVNEGPIFTYKDGKLCLIYSASGCWSQYYCLGLVEFVGEDFSEENFLDTKNWKKYSKSIFSAANEVYGVGHCSFFKSPDGTETWIAYHGMPTPDAGEEGRYLYLQKISFDEKGIPVLGNPLSRDTKIPYPAGDPKATVTPLQ